MGRKAKIPSETKLKYAKLCYERKISMSEAKRQLNLKGNHILEWVQLYEEQGELAFLQTKITS